MSTIDGSSTVSVGTVSATTVTIGRTGHTTNINSTITAIAGATRILDASDANYVALQAPATQAAPVTYTLPVVPSTSSQFLTSTTGGVMSWGTVSTASPFRYIVGPSGTQTTIQAAITQAVSDGASNSTPAIIYVTEGTYSGTVTLSDGIYVMGAPAFGFNTAAASVRSNSTAPPANGAAPNMAVKLTGQVVVTQTNTTAGTPNTINCGIAYVQFNYDTAATNLFQFSSQSGVGNAGAAIRFFLEQCYGAFSNVSLFGYTGNNDQTGSVTVFAQGCAFTYIAAVAGTAQWFNLDSTCTVSGVNFHTLTLDATDCIFTLNAVTTAFAFGALVLTMSRTTVNSSNQTTPAAGTLFTHTSAGSLTWTFVGSTISSLPINTATSQTLITHSGTGAVTLTGTQSTLTIGAPTTATFNGTLLSSTSAAAAITNLNNCNDLPPANPMFGGTYLVNLTSNTYAGGGLVVAVTDCSVQSKTNNTGTPYAGLDVAVGANNQIVQVTNLSVPNLTGSCPQGRMDLFINRFVKQVRMVWITTIETTSTSPTSLIYQVAPGQVFRFPNSSMTKFDVVVSAGNLTYADIYAGKIEGAFQITSAPAGTLVTQNTLATTTSTASVALVSPFNSNSFDFDIQATAPSASSYVWSTVATFVTTTSVGAT